MDTNMEFSPNQTLVLSYYNEGHRHIGGRIIEIPNPEKIIVRVFYKDRQEQFALRKREDQWRGQGVTYTLKPSNEKEHGTITAREAAVAHLPLVDFDGHYGDSGEAEQRRPARAARPTPGANNVCKCGCGTATTNHFAPGHDAKVKGLIKKVMRGQEPATVIPAMVIDARDQIGFVINNPEVQALLNQLAEGKTMVVAA